MFKQKWETTYQDHTIRVENSWFGSTKLFIDDSLSDERFGLFSLHLYGKINTDEVKIFVYATLLSVKCKIFINDKVIFPQVEVK